MFVKIQPACGPTTFHSLYTCTEETNMGEFTNLRLSLLLRDSCYIRKNNCLNAHAKLRIVSAQNDELLRERKKCISLSSSLLFSNRRVAVATSRCVDYNNYWMTLHVCTEHVIMTFLVRLKAIFPLKLYFYAFLCVFYSF